MDGEQAAKRIWAPIRRRIENQIYDQIDSQVGNRARMRLWVVWKQPEVLVGRQDEWVVAEQAREEHGGR